jgi:hypothetical protein
MFALEQTAPDKQVLLFRAAQQFLLLLTVLEAAKTVDRANSAEHPFAGNRIAYLVSRMQMQHIQGEKLSDEKDVLALIKEMHEAWRSPLKTLLSGGDFFGPLIEQMRKQHTSHQIPEAVAAVILYEMASEVVLREVKGTKIKLSK